MLYTEEEEAEENRGEMFDHGGMLKGEDVDETQHNTRTMQSKANFQTEPETPPLNVKH